MTPTNRATPPPGGLVPPEDGRHVDGEVHYEQQWFTCDCGTPEHVLRLSYFPSDDPVDRELFFSVFLQEHWFWGRCWAALK